MYPTTIAAYEDEFGNVYRLVYSSPIGQLRIEKLAEIMGWNLLHTYPIEDAARFR